MDFNADEIKEYTNDELQNELDNIIDEWDRSNTVFSLTDLMEIVRELTLREEQQ